MSGLLRSIRPKASQQQPSQPKQSTVAVVVPPSVAVAVVPPPAPIIRPTTTECPHRQTRVITIVPPEAFGFDATTEGKPHLIIDRTNEDWWERFEECLWCGCWFDLIEEESIEETKPFEW